MGKKRVGGLHIDEYDDGTYDIHHYDRGEGGTDTHHKGLRKEDARQVVDHYRNHHSQKGSQQ